MAVVSVPSNCYSPIKAQTIRITALDVCGNPLTGIGSVDTGATDASAGRSWVTNGFISVANSPQYQDGQTYQQKTAFGDPCVNQKDPSYLNWLQQTVTVCTMDPSLISGVTGYREIFAGSGPFTGSGVFIDDDALTTHFAMELWQPIAGAGACDSDGVQRYFYWVFYNMLDAKIQDFTMENDVFQFSWQANTEQASGTVWTSRMTNLYGSGRLNQTIPTAYTNLVGPASTGDHYAFNITTLAPPTAFCGFKVSSV